MHAALLLALGLAASSGAPFVSPLETEPGYRALDAGLKPRAKTGYLGLVAGLRPVGSGVPAPAAPAAREARHPRPGTAPAARPTDPAGRIAELLARLGPGEADPMPARESSRADRPGAGNPKALHASPAAGPVAQVAGTGPARIRAQGTMTWTPLPAGAARAVPWGSWLATGPKGRLSVELPGGRGRLDLAESTRLYLGEGLVRLQDGDVTVESGAPGGLRVATAKGRLVLGPGGRARILPGSFRRLGGPVAREG